MRRAGSGEVAGFVYEQGDLKEMSGAAECISGGRDVQSSHQLEQGSWNSSVLARSSG